MHFLFKVALVVEVICLSLNSIKQMDIVTMYGCSLSLITASTAAVTSAPSDHVNCNMELF